jgi:NAD(P)-dependent dehydrogenase (short-subunit alcohol dehydrogenase family)
MRPTDQTVILITGATDGLGRAVAERLAADGATLHLHGRDAGRLTATAEEIHARTGNDRLHTHRADLAGLAEVRLLADAVVRSTDRLHVLVSNAGIGTSGPEGDTRAESRDGHELRFAVNYLAGFVLTLRLLPLLRRSAPARIVNVASLGQSPIDFDDPMIIRRYSGTRAYGQSKLAQISSGFELAERLADEPVTVNSLHPATYMPTKMVREAGGRPISTIEEGVEATVRLAVAPDVEGVSGRFFDRRTETAAHGQAYDRDARARLWRLSVELTGEDFSAASAPAA